jgi:hypothetical protein
MSAHRARATLASSRAAAAGRRAALCAVLLLGCEAAESHHHSYDVAVPFATVGNSLGVWDGQEYRPVFIKGMNLGVAVPGTQAGDLAATREQYDRWFVQMSELGLNAIRTYTLHHPRFYQAFAHYNRNHPDKPLWLLHGVWLDEENNSGDLFDHTQAFDEGIREVVDCAHGECDVPTRLGRAHGRYRTDVTPWTIGWIIGREIAPEEVTATNALHEEVTSYAGETISLQQGTPLEAWFAERLDVLVRYERDNYGVERPVSVSSWPTLDPLSHPPDERELEPGVEWLDTEDIEQLDLENIDTSRAPAGYFASFHAYPYYPDSMVRDPRYQETHDEFGQNAYLGYLHHLKQHYATHPLLIAEFGVPTSWGNAHFGAGGMDHGGQDERQQGEAAARMLHNMLAADCAGGMFFAWIDEWWKRTWIVDELAMPRERYRLWHNVTSPEQNFGLIQFELPPPSFERWPAQRGQGRIGMLQADVDAEFFHVRVTLESPLSGEDTLTIAYDTYGDALGESILPSDRATVRRNEFALVIDSESRAQLYVTQAYDTFGLWHSAFGHAVTSPQQLFHSIASDGAPWVPVRWRNSLDSPAELLPISPAYKSVDEIGRMKVRRAGDEASIKDSVVIDGASIEVRIPWTLLHFVDPSTSTVLDDDSLTRGRETQVSAGVALGVELGADLVETERLAWERWEQAPATTERTKHSAAILSRALEDLP